MARIRMQEVSGIARLLFVISLVIGLAVTQAIHHPAPAIIGVLVGLYFLFAIKVVQQWEKVGVLRLGRYVGLRGPGMCHIIPVFETLSPYVDQRVRNHGPRVAAHPRRKDKHLGHHRAIRRNSRRENTARFGRCHVSPGPSRARASGPHHPWSGRKRNRRQLCASSSFLRRKSRGPAPARHEYALRSHLSRPLREVGVFTWHWSYSSRSAPATTRGKRSPPPSAVPPCIPMPSGTPACSAPRHSHGTSPASADWC